MSNTIFNKSIVWKSKFDTEDMLYLIGITQTKYSLAYLEDSNDPDYDSNTAYFLISQDPGSKNRKINLKETDIITLTGISSSISFGIDDSKGLLVFEPNEFSIDYNCKARLLGELKWQPFKLDIEWFESFIKDEVIPLLAGPEPQPPSEDPYWKYLQQFGFEYEQE